MTRRGTYLISGGAILLFLLSCSGRGSKCDRFISMTLEECHSALERGDYSYAKVECGKLLFPPEEAECLEIPAEVECEAHYAILISNLISLFDLIPSSQLPSFSPSQSMAPPMIPLQSTESSFFDFYDSIVLALKGENLAGILGDGEIFNTSITEVISYLELMIQLHVSPEELMLTLLNPILSMFYEMDRESEFVLQNGCSIYMDKVALPNTSYELRGEFDQTEAYLISGISKLVKGAIDLLFSYDLDFSLSYLINIILKLAGLSMEENYTLIDALREMGGLIYGSPNFLNWDPERKGLFEYADDELGQGLVNIGNFIGDLFSEQDENPSDDFMYWIDSDNSGGPNSGDEFCIHIHDQDTGEMLLQHLPADTTEIDVCGLFSNFFISQEIIDNYTTLFTEIGEGIKGDRGEDYRISLKSVFERLSVYIFQVAIKDVLFFLPRKFFGSPDERSPLRDLLPYTYDPNGEGEEPVVFLIEGEVYPGEGTRFVDGVVYQFEGDNTHFAIGRKWNETDTSVGSDGSIQNDCIEVTLNIRDWTLFYFGMKNPSWNGAIEVNPGAEGLPCGDPDAIQPANNYTLNKALAHIQASLYPLLDLLIQVLSGEISF